MGKTVDWGRLWMCSKFLGLDLTLVKVGRHAAVGRLLTASATIFERSQEILPLRVVVKSETVKLQETLTGKYSPNFIHHLGNTIQWVKFPTTKQALLWVSFKRQINCRMIPKPGTQQHVHNSYYKEQQPVDVNTICQFSDWDLKRSLRQ